MLLEKLSIVEELGEKELLVPGLLNSALVANNKIKYYFTLLQTAREKALYPEKEHSILRMERITAGENDTSLDVVVSSAMKVEDDSYLIPDSGKIINSILLCMDEMIRPLVVSSRVDAGELSSRLEKLRADVTFRGADLVTGELIQRITSGDTEKGDSLHLLVMDMHHALNQLQQAVAVEIIDGANAYMLGKDDRELVKAFMSGVNRTAPLKFGHPGLGTTATRTDGKLVIQNDIGETDAHVLVIDVHDTEVSVTYTDIHMPRLLFFHSLFEGFGVKWADTVSRSGKDTLEEGVYHLSVGIYKASNTIDMVSFLSHLGSRIVFLIDWNRARKMLRNFMRNRDAISVLKWAADNDVGHRGFLVLGGEKLVFDSLEMASRIPIRYGEPLSQVIGRERTIEFFQSAMISATTGLLENQAHMLLQDEIKAEMLRYFRTVQQELFELCSQHVSFTVEVAITVRDTLTQLLYGGDTSLAERNSQRNKLWESNADDIVNKVRSLSRRTETVAFFVDFIVMADDVLDYLEEASYLLTLVPANVKSKKIIMEISHMAELALEGCQEFLKSLYSSQFVRSSFNQEEMQYFLTSVTRIFNIEEECDVALRNIRRTILAESADHRENLVSLELAYNIEKSTNSLMKAALTLREDIFENINMRR
ncbi:hypothetical protein [uncultured Methanomethylovorans sp.]|uniref:hypothetical protein n=1 Tax=uncultured Methanomethylovorans sp. TaxID=183759 RepID=UPI00374A0B0F